MLERTSSGGFGGNDGFLYLTLPALPLGGVGEFLPPLSIPESSLLLHLDPGSGSLMASGSLCINRSLIALRFSELPCKL
jgi:hypothetical protein